jgi:Ca2+:H+ antiporter
MTLAAIAIVLPAAYFHSQYTVHKPLSSDGGFLSASPLAESTRHGLEIISHGTAVLLLVVYLAFLLFEVNFRGLLSERPDDCIAQNSRVCL